MSEIKFGYAKTKVRDLVAHTNRSETGKLTVDGVEVNGQLCEPSKRFWTSLSSNYGFSANIFSYFTHKEVFDRISEVKSNDELTVCVESRDGKDRLLAISNPGKAIAKHDDLIGLLGKQGLDTSAIDYGGDKNRPKAFGRSTIGTGGTMLTSTGAHSGPGAIGDGIGHNDGTVAGATPAIQLANIPKISYHDGVIRSVHEVRNSQVHNVAGDDFCNRFMLDTPIDGYGKPQTHLVLLRVICSNLAIGYSSVFRSEVSLGKGEDKFDYAIARMLEAFNNEEGFAALRDRFAMAAKSWTSVNEVNKAYKMLVRLHGKGEVLGVSEKFLTEDKDQFEGVLVAEGSPLIQSFHKMVGQLHTAYGLANLDALAVKRQATLPTGAKMYDMLNFLSETATHYTTPAGQRVIQAHIGELVSAEYDLEGTVDKWGEWSDFLAMDKDAAESKQIAQLL